MKEKSKTDIVRLKEKYIDFEKQLANILDKSIDLYEMIIDYINTELDGSEELTLIWGGFENSNTMRFKKCRKNIKVYTQVFYIDENDPVKRVKSNPAICIGSFNMVKFVENQYTQKFQKLIYMYIGESKFNISKDWEAHLFSENKWRSRTPDLPVQGKGVLNIRYHLSHLHLYEKLNLGFQEIYE